MHVIADNTRSGELVLNVDNLDDLWVLYNIIRKDDRVKSRTLRRVVIKEGDAGERKPMVLTVKASKVEFYEFGNSLRILGTIIEGPDDFVAIGEHHTLSIEPGTKLTIYKDEWLKNDIERIRRNMNRKDQILIIGVAIENGLANLALLSNYSLTPIAEIQSNIPGKRYDKQQAKEAMDSFFEDIRTYMIDHIGRYTINMILICGPGFTKENFADYLREELKKAKYIPPIRTLAASSGEISAIHEILKNGTIAELNSELTIAQDGNYMAEFVTRLGQGHNNIAYALNNVERVAEMGSIDTLLISDQLVRTTENVERKRIDDLLEKVEKTRGTVHIISSSSPAGDQLLSYGKVAALLRFNVNLDD
jgi:protein pelota